MLQMMMAGRVYETTTFKRSMDSNYFPLDNMKKSVAVLTNSQNIDIETMEFGQYQPILAPADEASTACAASSIRTRPARVAR